MKAVQWVPMDCTVDNLVSARMELIALLTQEIARVPLDSEELTVLVCVQPGLMDGCVKPSAYATLMAAVSVITSLEIALVLRSGMERSVMKLYKSQ